MPRRFLVFCFSLFFSSALLAESLPARQLADELLLATGTAAVLDAGKVRAALADPMPFIGDNGRARRARLIDEAGFRPWLPPRVWLLQSRREGSVEHWDNLAPQFAEVALARGYALVEAAPLPSAEQAFALLKPGIAQPGPDTLLPVYGADALVLLRGQDWSLWSRGRALQGRLAPQQMGLLPHVLAEALAALQQWPETAGRPVLEVQGVKEFADFTTLQAALQALPGMSPQQLTRVDKGRAWFALTPAAPEAVAAALDSDARLAALPPHHNPAALPAAVLQARALACPLLRRQWQPEAAPSADTPPVPGR
jgi:hypothetical protein